VGKANWVKQFHLAEKLEGQRGGEERDVDSSLFARDSLLPPPCLQSTKITPPAAHQTGGSDALLNRRGHKGVADDTVKGYAFGNMSVSSRRVFYCVQCGPLGSASDRIPIGCRFLCPRDQDHYAAVVKDPAGIDWLRFEYLIGRAKRRSLYQLFGGGQRIGLYNLCRGMMLFIALILASPDASAWISGLVALPAIYLLYESLLVATFQVFISRRPTSPFRTVLLTGATLFQIALSYAVFYRVLGSGFNVTLSRMQAFYFSVVTAATVGYGDIHPSVNAWHVQLLVVSEIVISVYVIVGLIGIVAGWVNQPPVVPPRPRLEELERLSRVNPQ